MNTPIDKLGLSGNRHLKTPLELFTTPNCRNHFDANKQCLSETPAVGRGFGACPYNMSHRSAGTSRRLNRPRCALDSPAVAA